MTASQLVLRFSGTTLPGSGPSGQRVGELKPGMRKHPRPHLSSHSKKFLDATHKGIVQLALLGFLLKRFDQRLDVLSLYAFQGSRRRFATLAAITAIAAAAGIATAQCGIVLGRGFRCRLCFPLTDRRHDEVRTRAPSFEKPGC